MCQFLFADSIDGDIKCIRRHRCRSGHLPDLEMFMVFVLQICACWTCGICDIRVVGLVGLSSFVGLVLVGRYIYGIDVYIYGIDVELVVCYVS